jgi:hypothetical protein
MIFDATLVFHQNELSSRESDSTFQVFRFFDLRHFVLSFSFDSKSDGSIAGFAARDYFFLPSFFLARDWVSLNRLSAIR